MLLYSVYGGSRLYNLDTKTSDYDARGVFIEPSETFFSLDTFDTYEDATSDTVMYSLRKFIRLALTNNPNTLELLFAPKHKWIVGNGYWNLIYQARQQILSEKALKGYKGFVLKEFDNLRARKSNRIELLERYGYDTKHASHILRLLHNARQIREYGMFNPSLSGEIRDSIYAVKTGDIAFTTVLQSIEEQMYNWKVAAPGLLLEPNYEYVNKLITDIQRTVLLYNLY